VEDARTALQRIVELSEPFSFRFNKIVVGGGSERGHLAACSVMIPPFDSDSFLLPTLVILQHIIIVVTHYSAVVVDGTVTYIASRRCFFMSAGTG